MKAKRGKTNLNHLFFSFLGGENASLVFLLQISNKVTSLMNCSLLVHEADSDSGHVPNASLFVL